MWIGLPVINMGSICVVLLTLLLHRNVESIMSNFNLVKVEADSWTTDHQRTQENRGPM